MLISFNKYQGTGNDFIMIDNRSVFFDPQRIDLVKSLCNRKFGIGGDGLILIQKHTEVDFEMAYFNSDGSQSLCGNGSRCAMMFAQHLGIIENKAKFMAIDGIHEAYIENDLVYFKMTDVAEVETIGNDFFVDTGSPHFVALVSKVRTLDVFNKGRAIRNSARFRKEGTNVNFVEQLGSSQCFVRTYERGVEAETLSCGTGATAVALALGSTGVASPVKISTLGGDLEVCFDKTDTNGFENIYLIGPAKEVFSGQVEV